MKRRSYCSDTEIKLLLPIITACCTIFITQVTAQTADNSLSLPENIKFAAYTAQDGLSNSHINDILQDKYGFLWIATNDGLNRFDGLKFETFYAIAGDSTTLTGSTVYDIYNDDQDNIWFGTFRGVCRYDYDKGIFISYPLPAQPNTVYPLPVRAVVQTPDKQYWLATSGAGLVKCDFDKKEYTFYRYTPNVNSIASDYLNVACCDDHGQIWLGCENHGVSIFNPETKTFNYLRKADGNLKSDVITGILPLDDGTVCVGTFNGGLTVWNSSDQSVVNYTHKPGDDFSIAADIVYSMATDSSNNIWCATQGGGICVLNRNTRQFKTYSNNAGNTEGLISDNIHCVYFDHDLNLWAGVFQGGLNLKKQNPYFDFINTDNSGKAAANKSVLCIYPDKNGLVYIGTDGNGLFIYDQKTKGVTHLKKSNSDLNCDIIRSIYKSYDGKMWFGTYLSGLQEYDTETHKFRTFENIPGDTTSLAHNDVTAIIEDRLGNLWAGTNGGGLNLYNPKTGTFKNFSHDDNKPECSLVSNWITKLYIDKRGYLWIGTFWGLSRLDPLRYEYRNFDHADCDGSNIYYCMLEDRRGRFWAGTANGLKLIDVETGEFQLFTTRDGLLNNVINGMEEDSEGFIWISTNNGLSKFNPDTKSFRNYSVEDGLLSNEFIHGSMAQGSNGEIFFGSIDGVNNIFPEKIKQNNAMPEILITDFMIFNKHVPVGELDDGRTVLKSSVLNLSDVHLQWSDNSFSVVFKALDFHEPKKIRYACRMRGFDNDWIYYDYTKNSATYTNLDPGTYFFEVKAVGAGEVWSKPVVLKIIIQGPFWKSFWAYLIYAIIIALGIFIIWKRYKSHIEIKHKAKIERLMHEKDMNLNRTRLQFFTNISHEFRTPLTLILGPLESMIESNNFSNEDKKRFTVMHRNADRLLRMVNEIMDLRKIDNNKMTLNLTKGDMVSFIKEIFDNFVSMSERYNIKFTFDSDYSTFPATFDKEKIDKAIYNLLSNSFKFTPKGGCISISIKAPGDNSGNIVIIVEDTGCGIAKENLNKIFERFFQGSSSSVQQGAGIGLWLTGQFVEMHQGIISVSSEPGKGTAFTVMIPGNLESEEKQAAVLQENSFSHIIPDKNDGSDNENSYTDFQGIEEKPEEEKIYTLLLIDDNPDILAYLKSGLSKLYKIETAQNGKEGLEKAVSLLPDLVVSDIMMPEPDGIELCKRLKTDNETCHIPVILLTAKATQDQKIEGLETGADSYIVKPFNTKHLLVRIEKLLELRRTLKEKFGSEISFNAEQTAVARPDKNLLKKVTDTIRKRISDPDLNVEGLSEEIGISRGHLQRKLKSLTGQNPNEFIRIIRLKHAAEILKKSDVSIAEAADLSGFNSQSYFSTAFTKQFGISPSQYKEDISSKKDNDD